MDHPAAVSHLVVLDSVPIGEALARCDAAFATAWWHWFFMGNPDAQADRVISADPDAWYQGDADRAAGRRVQCPVLVLWATRDDMEQLYGDPAAVWRRWASQVHGAPIDSGHHIAEEAPARLAAALLGFLPA